MRGGSRVQLQIEDQPGVRDEPKKINVALVRIHDGSLDFRRGRLDEHREGDRAWRVKLPENLGRANAIYVFVRFQGGDGSYIAGLK